jgi:arylsulfatase A-like enzyme
MAMQPRARFTDLLIVAAWFGLVTGLVESGLFLVFQHLGGLMDVPPEIVTVAPPFDLVLFGLCGLAFAAPSRRFPALPLHVSVFLFVLLAMLDWLAIAIGGRIHYYAVTLLALGVTVQVTRWLRRHEAAALRGARRSLPWVCAVALLAFAGTHAHRWLRERLATVRLPAATAGAPNVLVIVVDTLRADHLSSYGYTRPTSPHVDRLAQQGVVFENAIAPTSWTLPSHASLLTGRYLYEHGVDWNTPRQLFDGRFRTLGEALELRGYRTAAFSANLFWFTRSQGFGRGFIHFDDYFHCITDMLLRTLYGRAVESIILRRVGSGDSPARRTAASVNAAALRWIDRDPTRPFFVFLNYLDTHDPYLPPRPFRGMFSKLANPGGLLNGNRPRPHLTPEQLAGEIAAYDGGIAYVDDQIGRLLDELQRRHLDERTLVVFTSDHGEAFGEHRLFLHANGLHWEVIHVPLVFWWPGHIPEAVHVTRPVSNAALAATVMDLLGAGAPELFPGPSLRRLWTSPDAPLNWPDALSEISAKPWAPPAEPVHDGALKSLVTPRWHYIVHETLGSELYDWRDDPQESHNLVAAVDQSALTDMRSRLDGVPWPGTRSK